VQCGEKREEKNEKRKKARGAIFTLKTEKGVFSSTSSVEGDKTTISKGALTSILRKEGGRGFATYTMRGESSSGKREPIPTEVLDHLDKQKFKFDVWRRKGNSSFTLKGWCTIL